MKYYPARKAERYPSHVAALKAVGFSDERAQQLVQEAEINQSSVVVVDIGDGKGVALTATEEGGTQLWQACISLLCDTEDEARRYADEIDAGLPPGSTWAIFNWTEPHSKGVH